MLLASDVRDVKTSYDIEFKPINYSTIVTPSPNPDTKPNPDPAVGNNGEPYSAYDSAAKTLNIVVDGEKKISFEDVQPQSSHTSYGPIPWYVGLDKDLDTQLKTNQDEALKTINITAKDSTLTLVSTPSLKKSISLGEGDQGINITAKQINIGAGDQDGYTDLPSCGFGGSGKCPATIYVMNENSSIKSNVVVNKDGMFGLGNKKMGDKESLTHFTLEGDLSVNGGKFGVASMGGASNPDFYVAGKAEFRDGEFVTFISTSGEMERVKVLSAGGGITLSGENKMHATLSLFLQDFVKIAPDNIDYGWAMQAPASDLYRFTLEKEGNTLYATPELVEDLKSVDSKEFAKKLNDAKNDIASKFFIGLGEMYQGNSCPSDGDDQKCKDRGSSLQSLGDYLKEQVNNGKLEVSPDKIYPKPYPLSSTQASTKTGTQRQATGFDHIDSKIATIQEEENAPLAEGIRRSSNNLLAVNFVNSMLQGYSNASIETIEESKGNLSSLSSLPSLFRNDLHTTLALSSRFASFSFAPKKNEIDQTLDPRLNPSNTQALLDLVQSESKLLSNSLWANVFGGANLLGSSVEANYGINLGYDKTFDSSLLGAYLSYEYATLKPSTLSASSHNIKLGLYSRIEKERNEIDLELSTLLSIASAESKTQAIASVSKADFLSSLTELKATYGYAFLEGEFRIKPLLGVGISYSYTPSFKQSGDIALSIESLQNFNADAQVGVEFRKSFLNQGFLYSTITIEQDLYNSLGSISYDSASLSLSKTLKTYAQVLIGGEISIAKDWNIALSLGAKQSIIGGKDYEGKSVSETYINGNLGVGYRF